MENWMITKNYLANGIAVKKYVNIYDDNIVFFKYETNNTNTNCYISNHENTFIPNSIKKGFMAIVKNIFDGVAIEMENGNITILIFNSMNNYTEYSIYPYIMSIPKNYTFYPLISSARVVDFSDIKHIISLMRNKEYKLHFRVLQSKIEKLRKTIEHTDFIIKNSIESNNANIVLQNAIYNLNNY